MLITKFAISLYKNKIWLLVLILWFGFVYGIYSLADYNEEVIDDYIYEWTNEYFSIDPDSSEFIDSVEIDNIRYYVYKVVFNDEEYLVFLEMLNTDNFRIYNRTTVSVNFHNVNY